MATWKGSSLCKACMCKVSGHSTSWQPDFRYGSLSTLSQADFRDSQNLQTSKHGQAHTIQIVRAHARDLTMAAAGHAHAWYYTFSRSSGDGGVSPTARLNAASLSPGWGLTDGSRVPTGDAGDWVPADALLELADVWLADPVTFCCSAMLAQLPTPSATLTTRSIKNSVHIWHTTEKFHSSLTQILSYQVINLGVVQVATATARTRSQVSD